MNNLFSALRLLSISFLCILFLAMGYRFFYYITISVSIVSFVLLGLIIPCFLYKSRITALLAKPFLYVLRLTKMIRQNGSVNLAEILGGIIFTCVFLILHSLHKDTYEMVLVGIMTGCLVGGFMHIIYYNNEKDEFILHTFLEIAYILTYIDKIIYSLKELTNAISNTTISRKDEIGKLSHSKSTHCVLSSTDSLSNSIKILTLRIIKYDDFAKIALSLIVPLYKKIPNERIVEYCDHNIKNTLDRRVLYSLDTLCSIFKNIHMLIPIANNIHYEYINMQNITSDHTKSFNEDNAFDDAVQTKVFELNKSINILATEFFQNEVNIIKAMRIFAQGAKCTKSWTEIEKEFKLKNENTP